MQQEMQLVWNVLHFAASRNLHHLHQIQAQGEAAAEGVMQSQLTQNVTQRLDSY